MKILIFGKILIGIFFITILLQSCKKEKGTYGPIWSDEFNYQGLPDSTKWSYDVGDGCPNLCGWGNNELQYYTSGKLKNARVVDGRLIIEARKENIENKQYSSTRLVSKHKGDWLYGRIEVRAKLPAGVGTWPAIWMLPTDWEYGGWPASGEIDIMEHVGYVPDTIYGTVHTQAYNHVLGTHLGDKLFIPDSEDEFHVYSINWMKEKIDFFIDNNKYFTFDNKNKTFAEYPFDKKFHLILNMAVGGNWGGKKGVDDSIFPQKMEIDYVRVYDLEDWEKGGLLSKR